MPTMPSIIAQALSDPKCADTSTLAAAMGYVDQADPEAYALAGEEFARRGGDYDYMPPEYD